MERKRKKQCAQPNLKLKLKPESKLQLELQLKAEPKPAAPLYPEPPSRSPPRNPKSEIRNSHSKPSFEFDLDASLKSNQGLQARDWHHFPLASTFKSAAAV